MLVLYETAMGYCLFKVSDTAKIESADVWEEFETPEKASKLCVSTYSSARVGGMRDKSLDLTADFFCFC